ncbi:MAG: hypothetical protein AB1726_03385 [Planctomycetota bacterium]
MKKILSLVPISLASLLLLAASAAAQADRVGTGGVGPASVPTSNPEPLTWAALLGGAALAGAIAARLRRKVR